MQLSHGGIASHGQQVGMPFFEVNGFADFILDPFLLQKGNIPLHGIRVIIASIISIKKMVPQLHGLAAWVYPGEKDDLARMN